MLYLYLANNIASYLTPVSGGLQQAALGIGKGANTGDGTAILTGIDYGVTSIGTGVLKGTDGRLDHGTVPSIFDEADASRGTQTPKDRTKLN